MTFLLLPPYLIIAIIVIWKVLKRVEGKGKKWSVFFLLVFAFYLPLGWDVILGRAYFYYLCETQGGVHVYQTVELGPKYWDDDGNPGFIYSENGELDELFLANRYTIIRGDKKAYSKTFRITSIVTELLDNRTNDVIADRVIIFYGGGWFLNNSGFHVDSLSCFRDLRGLYPSFLSHVFKQRQIKEGE